MKTPKNKLIALGAVSLLAVVGTLMNSPSSAVQAAGGGPTVTIEPSQLPLPVRGTVTVAAVPTAVLADSQLISNINFGTPGNNPVLGPLDVSLAKSIRLNIRRSDCSGCTDIEVEVRSGLDIIDKFTLITGLPTAWATRVYDVPGTSLTLRFTSGGGSNSVIASVYAIR